MNRSRPNKFSFEELVFTSNLTEFSQRVAHICCLLNHAEMSTEDAEREVGKLYEQLERSAKNLGISP